VTYVCGVSGELSPSSGPSVDCSANACETSTLPSGAGVDTTDCTGKLTSEECTAQCEQGYTAVGSLTAACSASGEFTHSIACEANACDTSSLPVGVTMDSCTTGMECTGACRAGYAEATASFSCLSSGSFEGELACGLVELDLDYQAGDASEVRELSFSVEQGGEQLVAELADPNSAASQAVATSFQDAMGLPEDANVQVMGASLQRRLTHERRLQQALAANLEISGVSEADFETLDNALETGAAADAMGAHLETNLAQVEGIDVGSVSGVTMRRLPADASDASGNSTGFLEPDDGGCGQWEPLLAMVLAFRVFL